ncbi:lysosomal Pro-X carboxypeptidase, partial [Tanacetum coccineum]
VCSEMVIPISITSNVSMFSSSPYDAQEFIDECKKMYGVTPRAHWATTYYGGQDIKRVLRRFGSNIIFSNGLRDPYSSGGVLEDISPTILAVKTTNGSHCLDILNSKATDPDWLIKQAKGGMLEIFYYSLFQNHYCTRVFVLKNL